MTLVLENLRLKDLVAVVKQNQAFYHEFADFLQSEGYDRVHDFINEKNDDVALNILNKYLSVASKENFHDGLGRPYKTTVAKWYFLAWMLRDAPVQRLEPLLKSVKGSSTAKKRAALLNQLRKFVGPLFPEANKWEWPVLSEVILARLEGSRRALKGSKIEGIIRNHLHALFKANGLPLQVSDKEIRIHNETYDIQITDGEKILLMPVKTRETMGGGHANLFTRDIFKSISVAHENGYSCIPIIIAESWTGDLESLKCEKLIVLKTNPNQTEKVEQLLEKELVKLLPTWRNFAGKPDETP